MVASDRLSSKRSDVGNRQHSATGVGVNGLHGHQSVNGGPPDAQRGGDGEDSTGSRWLVMLPTRDTTGATPSTVSPESRCTIELRSTSRPEALFFSSSWRDAAATLHSEPDRPAMDTVGCWRAAQESKPVKCYLPEELDRSPQAFIGLDGGCRNQGLMRLDKVSLGTSGCGGCVAALRHHAYIPEAVVGTEVARRLTSPTLGVGGRIASGVAMDTACEIQRRDHPAGAWRHDRRPLRCRADTGPVEEESVLK